MSCWGIVGLCWNVICILELQYLNDASIDDRYMEWSVGQLIVCFSRLPVDGTAVPKFVGFVYYVWNLLYFLSAFALY
jgi:hypothetical protein